MKILENNNMCILIVSNLSLFLNPLIKLIKTIFPPPCVCQDTTFRQCPLPKDFFVLPWSAEKALLRFRTAKSVHPMSVHFWNDRKNSFKKPVPTILQRPTYSKHRYLMIYQQARSDNPKSQNPLTIIVGIFDGAKIRINSQFY